MYNEKTYALIITGLSLVISIMYTVIVVLTFTVLVLGNEEPVLYAKEHSTINTTIKHKTIPEPKVDEIVEEVEVLVVTEDKIDEELYLLAQIIDAEAKGEPYEGKIAVGNVIMNRVDNNSFPDTIEDVIFQKGQFQPVSNGSIYNEPSDVALEAAEEVLDGKKVVNDNTLFFYNPSIATDSWIFSRNVVKNIGNHAFAM